jgi:cell division protein FtsZ
LHNPLLEDIPLKEAKGVLINVVGGPDLTLSEVDEIASVVREAVDSEANIIFGSTLDEKYNGKVRVSVIITGMDKASQAKILTSPVEKVFEENSFWNVVKKYW